MLLHAGIVWHRGDTIADSCESRSLLGNSWRRLPETASCGRGAAKVRDCCPSRSFAGYRGVFPAGQLIGSAKCHASTVMTVRWSPSGRVLLSGGLDNCVVVFNGESLANKTSSKVHAGTCTTDACMMCDVVVLVTRICWRCSVTSLRRPVHADAPGVSLV